MRVAVPLVVGLLSSAGLVGCRPQAPPPQAGPPPLRVSFRKSQIPTQGMVAGVNNPSAAESVQVVAVFVQGKGEKEERSYRLDREVKPLDSISVGWAELGGWKLKRGDKLRIRCEGYTSDLACEVSD
ncbi:MAG TPA: hypothetical protein VH682_27330 [Gemmataceae bacterium]